jgi:hypothetical protein
MRLSATSIGPAGLAWPVECARHAAGTLARPTRQLLGLWRLVKALLAVVALRW